MSTVKERIARYRHLIKVMRNLTPHQRRHHFNMELWQHGKGCGTSACAAGWAGLNRWFKRRGFKATKGYPVYGYSVGWSAVRSFFDGGDDWVSIDSHDMDHPVFGKPKTVEEVIEAAKWMIYGLERFGE